VTSAEYQRICERLARKAIRFATKMVADEEPGDGDAQRVHWIHVFVDEHMPDIDADALLEVTPRADAWDKSGGHRYAGKEVRAIAAFQADVWAAINGMEAT
jgi:hypothetical protein